MRAVRSREGDPDPAVFGEGVADMVEHPLSIARPMVRRGFLERGPASDRTRRGAGPFVALPRDEALELAGGELARVRAEHGNRTIFGGSCGWASAGRFHKARSQVHRFLSCIGGYTASVDTYSFAAVSALTPHVVGHFRGVVLNRATSRDSIAEHGGLVVMISGLAAKNAQGNSGGVARHTTRGRLREARRAAAPSSMSARSATAPSPRSTPIGSRSAPAPTPR